MKRKLVLVSGIINAGLGAALLAFNSGKTFSWQHLVLIAGVAASAYAMKWPGETNINSEGKDKEKEE